MKTLFFILCTVFSLSFSNGLDGNQIELEKSKHSITKNLSEELIEASIDNAHLVVDISNYIGFVYYQIEDAETIVDSGYAYISGNGQISKNLSLLDPGIYTLKIQAGFFYVGTFNL